MACSGIIRPYNITTNASCSNPDYCKTPQQFGSKDTAHMFCSDSQVLPCFLRFSDESLPLDDASNMRCRYILRKLPQQAKEDCAEATGMYGLGPDADEVMPDIVRDAQQQQWMLDPMYFQYRGCSCLTVSGGCRLFCCWCCCCCCLLLLLLACMCLWQGCVVLAVTVFMLRGGSVPFANCHAAHVLPVKLVMELVMAQPPTP
jgi:hypothetical protein